MGERLSILIVGDDAAQRELVSRAFARGGIATDLRTATNAREAEAVLSEAQPTSRLDVVLLDIGSPDLDGIKLLMRLRRSERWHDLPVFIMSDLTAPDQRARCYELGISGIIFKSDVTNMLESARMISRVVNGEHSRQRETIDQRSQWRISTADLSP